MTGLERTPSTLPQLEIEGYACVFSQVDKALDIVLKGAFLNSLKQRPPVGVRMLKEHDGEAVGVWEDIHEDDYGLKVRGVITVAGEKSGEAAGFAWGGLCGGLSIGFRALRSSPGVGGIRKLSEINLLEISLVANPVRSFLNGRDPKPLLTGIPDRELGQ